MDPHDLFRPGEKFKIKMRRYLLFRGADCRTADIQGQHPQC